MIIDKIRLCDIVTVDATFKPSVQLPHDFYQTKINDRLIETYIPTSQSVEILFDIAKSLDPNSTERARALVGTFGTGKSDLLLIIANYLQRSIDDPVMARFYERLKRVDPARAEFIKTRRENIPPFLVILLQADTVSAFPGFVLHGLQEALDSIGLSHLMAKTRYAAAIEQIENWRKGEHPRYQDFRQILAETEKMDVSGLLAGLKGAQADAALKTFQRVFRDVTGSDFHLYGYSQPHEAFATVARDLVETKKYSGIALICDEFTSFLERLQRAIDQNLSESEAESKAIENLAERSCSSGRFQIHFIIASLESFASAAEMIGSASVSKATERSGGRFKQYSLQVEGSEELICGAIQQLSDSNSIQRLLNPQRDELLIIAESIWNPQGRNRQWIRDKIIDGAFPLHPITTYTLPLINQRVAQSQRTMFLFLSDNKGLKGFIQREPLTDETTGWSNLLTLDALFDYFRESIATKRSDIFETFERSEGLLQEVTLDKELASRILKVIALCETLGSDPVTRPTRQFLRRALNLPPSLEGEISRALDILEQIEAIEPPSDPTNAQGIYRLPSLGWVSTRKLNQYITQRAQQLRVNAAKLQAVYPAEDVKAITFNRERGSHRKLKASYVDILRLRSREQLKRDLEAVHNREGVLWYCVASTDDERAEAQHLARELTANEPRLVIAIPITPTNILSRLRDYEALQELRSDPTLDQQSKAYLADHGRVGQEYKNQLEKDKEWIGNPLNWEWYANGHSSTNLRASDVSNLASKIMEKAFPNTPNTGLEQHFTPDRVGQSVMKAVEAIIKNDFRITKTSKKAEDLILRTGLTTLGLLALNYNDRSFEHYRLINPSTSANLASSAIWRRIEEHLKQDKPLDELIHHLRQPPFGLYDSIVIIFLTAFLVQNADTVAIVQRSGGPQTLDITPDLLKKLLERPENYIIRYQPLNEAEHYWLRGLVERGLDQTIPYDLGRPLQTKAAHIVRKWLDQQRLPVFAASLDQEKMQELLPDSDSSVFGAVKLLLQSKNDDIKLENLILHDLPHHLGAPEQHVQWNPSIVDDLLRKWINVCEIVKVLPIALQEHTIRRTVAVFGFEHLEPKACWTAIHQWRAKRSAIKPEQLKGQARELFRLTNISTGSVEDTLLNEFARRIIVVGVEYQRWPDLNKFNKFFDELREAYEEIENVWKEVAQGDEIWREGLARLFTGQTIISVTSERLAGLCHAWMERLALPRYVQSLDVKWIRNLYPEYNSDQVFHDLAYFLQRYHYTQQQWFDELEKHLPFNFGIREYARDNVNTALQRVELSLRILSEINKRISEYVQHRVIAIFAKSLDIKVEEPYYAVLADWFRRYQIPEPNDLSTEAKHFLASVQRGYTNPEHLLLETLPLMIAPVNQGMHAWESLEPLTKYEQGLSRLIIEVTEYQPLNDIDHVWLTGVLEALCRPIPTQLPRERQRLLAFVSEELQAWLKRLNLPPFAASLSRDELEELVNTSDHYALGGLELLLGALANPSVPELVNRDLPVVLGLPADREQWDEAGIQASLSRLRQICRATEHLPAKMRQRVRDNIAQVFGITVPSGDSWAVLKAMCEWREQYVVLPDTQISPNARLLYDSLSSPNMDAESFLFDHLPVQISEIKQPYHHWSDPSMQARYLKALDAAVKDITGSGEASTGSISAQALWNDFFKRFNALSDEEKRWIIKTFRKEIRQ